MPNYETELGKKLGRLLSGVDRMLALGQELKGAIQDLKGEPVLGVKRGIETPMSDKWFQLLNCTGCNYSLPDDCCKMPPADVNININGVCLTRKGKPRSA